MAKSENKANWLKFRILAALATGDFWKITSDGQWIRGFTMTELASATGAPYDNCRKSLPALVRDGWALRFPWVVGDRCAWVYLLSKRGFQFLQINGRILQEIAAAGLIDQRVLDSILQGVDGDR
ncbi:MAG: hypothetical protein PHD54_16040 [Desulfuromonadaceae bacterium]|nr:hypothetical protein [Desulfuromonadaceae bacterium]